ncbi:MAG: class I SAM-dependent methyltransferase [Kiloniellaceae bacterium]
MNLAAPETEPPVIAGNVYPKYHTRNPIARRLVAGFLAAFRELTDLSGAENVLEVGCGEGFLSGILAAPGRRIRGIDISPAVIEIARRNPDLAARDIAFEVASVYDLDPLADAAELVICCEVLEHLKEPERALGLLAKLASPYLLVSVPREPLWRILNIMRGRYLADFGNTPGHLQHWSRRSFLGSLARYVDIVEVKTPLPWTMALCRSRHPDSHVRTTG